MDMIHIGTSGWQYASWSGRFYPSGLPTPSWLTHYAARFRTVEVNNSFYRLPEEKTFARWRVETPSEFLFAVKASRFITHVRRLRECRDPVHLFWSRAGRLGSKLGPVLFQLPPNFPADPDRLLAFVKVLPARMRAAFEFRDESWRSESVTDVLNEARAAWVLADRPRQRVPLVVTGGWAYVRFHQGRTGDPGYTRAKLRTWAERIAELPARDTFVFFNNDAGGAAPRDAHTLVDLLAHRGVEVATPGG